jgi:hypothetical protein
VKGGAQNEKPFKSACMGGNLTLGYVSWYNSDLGIGEHSKVENHCCIPGTIDN